MIASEAAINWETYQRKWIQDPSRYKIGMITRRGGKTFGVCGEILADCIDAELTGRQTRWTILSRSEVTAKEALEDALKPMTRAFYAAANIFAQYEDVKFENQEFQSSSYVRTIEENGNEYQELVPEAKLTAREIKFPGGSRVVAISASPDSARGFGGNVVLDEFAFHRDSRLIWRSAFPVVSRSGHKMRVISTPNGKGNKFFELMTTDDPRWSKHHVDIYQAVEQGLDVDIDELRSGMADEDGWAQEYELKWLDEASSWLSYDLIAGVEREGLGDPQRYLGGPCYVGVDIGARRDLFVIWVMEKVDDKLVTREIIAERNITFREQDMLLASVFARYQVIRCRMDQTGMGEKPVEDAKRNHGQVRVEGIIFTPGARLDMATTLKEGMQDRTTLIPAADPILRADLHSVKSHVGVTGQRRLLADNDSDGHADRFWAGALAVSAAELEYQPFDYQAVRRDGEVDRDIKITGGFGAQEGVW